ncbi:T9SS type A sorting domain-containing protein [Winogradskyella sp. 3972H.M.0a.05]|uniref:T9SS type A sorting domain-containing protein n=1 Tax=Winogradskyella sp. 3972H.M.0a.05 TaxID=2950277 RepID=UPI00339299D1
MNVNYLKFFSVLLVMATFGLTKIQAQPNIPLIRLSESSDPDLIQDGRACAELATNTYHENAFYRFYDLQNYVDDSEIDSGEFMITNLEFAQASATDDLMLTYFIGTIPRSEFYLILPNNLPYVTISLNFLSIIGSGNYTCNSSDNGTLINIPIDPITVSTDQIVYYSVQAAAGDLDTHFFAIGGSNLAGNTRTYFNTSGVCDLPELNDPFPDTIEQIPTFDAIMNLYGISNPSAIGPPLNDTCETATTLTVGTSFEDNPVDFTTLNATQDGGGCNDGSALIVSNEIWVQTTIPPEGHLVVETGPDVLTGNTNFVSGMDAWQGTACDNLMQLPSCGISNYSLHDFSSIIIEGTPGETVYVRVFGNFVVPFAISAYNPPVPTNMVCENATPLTVGATFEDQNVDSSFLWTDVNGLWFNFTAPSDGNVTIETGPDATGLIAANTSIAVLSGTCTSFSFIGSDQNSGDFSFSKLDLTGLTPGENYFVIVNDLFSTYRAPFSVSVYNETLGLDETAFNNFNYYPNPVNNVLNFDSVKRIDQVIMHNALGQQVLSLQHDNGTGIERIDMSSLPEGLYFCKITIDKQSKIVKVIKD